MTRRRGGRRAWVAGIAVTLLVPAIASGRAAARAVTPSPGAGAVYAAALAGASTDSSLLVRVAPDASRATEDAIVSAAGAEQAARIAPTVLEVKVPPGTTAERATILRARPDVRTVESNHTVRATAAPNDPGYSVQWGVQDAPPGIGTPTAWQQTTGSSSVVVGVLDTGIDLGHPDLAANLWSNPGGVGGCAAGTHGYSEVESSCVPQDGLGHGTHVSGIIGAVGNNNLGVTGVNWTTRLMGIRVLDDAGVGSLASVIAGINFAVQAKNAGVNIRVLNASFSDDSGSTSLAFRDAIVSAGDAGILFVAAAGNSGRNLDGAPAYPCSFRLANEICVGATTSSPSDTMWSGSNYGPATVDIGAPGAGVVSTWLGGYATADGTSMATPHVTGTAALMLAAHDMPVGTLRTMLLSHEAPLEALSGRFATGGRVDAGCAVGATLAHWCAWDTPAPTLPGGLTTAPAISSWAPGRLDAFGRDTGGQLVHTWDTGQFSGWENLGGGLRGAPAAISWYPNRVDVFARGTDDQLWHRWYAGGWSKWEPLGGGLTSAPTVASWFPGRLDVFARGTDQQLWHRWYAGGWSVWEPLGGVLTGDPGSVSWGIGRVDVAARGTDGQLWHRWYAGGWSVWEPLGGQVVGGTALSSLRSGALDIFFTGTNGHLWHRWFDGTWHAFDDVGGSLTSAPSSVSRTSTRIDIVGRAPGDQLTRLSWRE